MNITIPGRNPRGVSKLDIAAGKTYIFLAGSLTLEAPGNLFLGLRSLASILACRPGLDQTAIGL